MSFTFIFLTFVLFLVILTLTLIFINGLTFFKTVRLFYKQYNFVLNQHQSGMKRYNAYARTIQIAKDTICCDESIGKILEE
ncbi:hypothetical protein [Bacillus gaemokensis]|uniref:Uncharacterized protein n=1 Tax=Bacillus gaemokensis TaxID=574375 RepID=A0A073KDZ7_9BACI|nr:hypothetical protein [Bacillus gaemokensis]KEK24692.1 hypothetical protein BAGA_23795 [Bacillus gaemokensis]KYG34512.1 hypothetical protein AZF08_08930 [Bacillus gaemokensis]